MKDTNGWLWGATKFAAIVGAVLAGTAGCSNKQEAAPPAATEAAQPAGPPTLEQMLAATVTDVLESPVTLANGRFEGPPAAEGGASRPTLQLWEPTILFRNVDGTPGEEGIALMSASGGGSGEFVHLGVFALRDGKATTIATAPVGDRVQLLRAWVEHDQVHMDVVEAGPQDPACCPTQLARKTFAMKDGKLQMTGSEVVGSLSLNLLAATDWMLVEMDGKPLPQGTMPPTALIQYGKIAGFAGCNRYSGPVTEPQAGSIKVGELATTRKACEGPATELEAAFLERLGRSETYRLQAGRLLFAGPQDGQDAKTLLFSR